MYGVLGRPEDGIRLPRMGVTDDCGLLWMAVSPGNPRFSGRAASPLTVVGSCLFPGHTAAQT